MKLEDVLPLVTTYPDFPSPGILFYDVFSLFQHPEAIKAVQAGLTDAADRLAVGGKIDAVIGLDARGFLFGPALALHFGAAFVPIRKAGKLPGDVIQVSSTKEYGQDVLQMQKNALKPGARVLIVDDLLATGGTARSAITLAKEAGAEPVGALFVFTIDVLSPMSALDIPSETLFRV